MVTVRIQQPGKTAGFASIERSTDDKTERQSFDDDGAIITTPTGRIGVLGAKFFDDNVVIEIVDKSGNKYSFQVIG